MAQTERIQKLLSQSGVASRRKAEIMVKEGHVLINGVCAQIGDQASFDDLITVKGKPISKNDFVYYLINKPSKVLCSRKDKLGRPLIIDLISDKRYFFPVGRLDWDTTGTLLLTNDGHLTNKLTHPRFKVKRVYRARLSRPLAKDELSFLNSPKVMLEGKVSKQVVEQVDKKTYLITIALGSYHHIKRLFELVDNEVISLTRISFGGISHIGLKKGQYRPLKLHEIKMLKNLN